MPDWRPRADLATLRARARMLASIRAFFAARGVLEVETPLLSSAATTDPSLHSLSTRWPGPDGPRRWLPTSPEFHMKRLLAAGSGSIYQLGRVFRDRERGRLHHPEFTLLEWYRVGWDHERLIDEVVELAAALLPDVELAPAERLGYREAFLAHAGIDPLSATVEELARAARGRGIDTSHIAADEPRATWCDLLLTHCVEPLLGRGRLTFVLDYPAWQPSLARHSARDPRVVERFELYWQGIELANGFHELADAAEQRRRFATDLRRRRESGACEPPPDTRLLAALEAGLPDCAGVALGVDRLLMLAAGKARIDDVLAFPVESA